MASQITFEMQGESRILELLERLPKLIAGTGGPIDNAVKKAAKIVEQRARQIAPDSKQTGSREKQSQKAKATWNNKLRRTIRSKVIKYPTTSWAVVGAKSPEGNMAHFLQEEPRRNVLWGKATAINQIRIERNWITRAFDETRDEQFSAMEASLKSDIDANMRS